LSSFPPLQISDLTAQRQCLRRLAASRREFAHVADNLNASLFKAIDLLSPAKPHANSEDGGTNHSIEASSRDRNPSTPHKWRPIPGNGAAATPAKASATGAIDAPATAANADLAVAFAARQAKHEAEMAAVVLEAHEAQLKIATKTLQQEAALQDRRAGRTPTGGFFGSSNGSRLSGSSSPSPSNSSSTTPSSPDGSTTAATANTAGAVGGSRVARTNEDAAAAVEELQTKLESAVRGREVAVLRAQRSEFMRALFHLGKRAGRESLLVALLRWKKQVHDHTSLSDKHMLFLFMLHSFPLTDPFPLTDFFAHCRVAP